MATYMGPVIWYILINLFSTSPLRWDLKFILVKVLLIFDTNSTVDGGNNSNAAQESQAYLAVIIGVLVAVSLLLAAAIFFMILRHRQRKSLGSPLPDKAGWANVTPVNPSPRLTDPLHHRAHNGASNGSRTLYSKSGTLPYCDPRTDVAASQFLLPQQQQHLQHVIKTEYQEPYHALQFSPYYSYSTLLLAGTGAAINEHAKKANLSQGPGESH